MRSENKLIPALILAFLCAVVFKTFVLEGFVVRGESMGQSIESGNYIFINKLAFLFTEPKRGDIVVATPRDLGQKVIKRVVGLPGERVRVEGNVVVIKQNRLDEGTIISENYVSNDQPIQAVASEFQIDPHEYFLMGDNRTVSIDSRELGAVDQWDIKGKVFLLFDFNKMNFSLIH